MKGYLRKRGENAWQLAVYLGKDDQGKKQYLYETVHGTKRDAQRRLAALVAEHDGRRIRKPEKLTVAEYLQRWLQDHARQAVRQSTYEFYEKLVRLFIVPSIGHIMLDRLTPLDLQHFYTSLASRPGRNGPIAPKTIKHVHGVLRTALRRAVKWQLIKSSPAEAVDPPRAARREMTVWTPDQVARFLEVAREHRLYAAFLLAVGAGLRRGEILGLRWQDVDLERGWLAVRQALIRTDTAGNILEEPKTAGSRRLVALSPATVQALRERLAESRREKEAYQEDYHDTGLVFTTPDGKPIDPRNFTKVFERLAARAGLPRIRFHDLRHTHATVLLAEGVPAKVISERLGHSDIGTTMDTYAHVPPVLQEDAARRIDVLFRLDPKDGQEMGKTE